MLKSIAAGANHNLVSAHSHWVQYPVDVTKDLLLVYNTNSTNSIVVKDYYLAHRPLVSGANVKGVGCPVGEFMGTNEFVTQLETPIRDWLNANPTKHPSYIILFLDIPARLTNLNVQDLTLNGSVGFALHDRMSGIKPFVTTINMNGTNDCIGYINKLASIGASNSPGKLVLSASAGGIYGNTNYVVDNVRHGEGYVPNYTNELDTLRVSAATNGLIQNGVSSSAILYAVGLETIIGGVPNDLPHLTNAVNVAGYISWGIHSSLGGDYALTNGAVKWSGNSGWWIIQTAESYNGQRVTGYGNFIKWYSPSAFGGANYANTPVGAVSYVEEPGADLMNDSAVYFGLWASGKVFGIAAWQSQRTVWFQAVGDPFVAR